MLIVCSMFLTGVATCLFVNEISKKDFSIAKMMIYALNILALAWIFTQIG